MYVCMYVCICICMYSMYVYVHARRQLASDTRRFSASLECTARDLV